MKSQDLKKSILQYAMQGKLVPQDPNDEPASELLKRIKTEKEQLIKNGKIKKEKPLPPITQDEIPYDLPQGWGWVRLGGICKLEQGTKVNNVRLPLLNTRYLRYRTDKQILSDGQLVQKDNYIILVDGENSGEVFKVFEDGIMGSTFKLLSINSNANIDFILYILKYYQDVFRYSKKGAAIPHLDKELFKNIVIGVPPLAEQKRIVEKLEEILPLVDEYGKNEKILSEMNQKLPKQIRQSILQYAVQGKLVEQNPQDESASELLKRIKAEKEQLIKDGKIKKEKPFPPITQDEILYDLPQGWEWVRVNDLGTYKKGPFGSALTKKIFVPKSDDTIKVYEQKNAIQKNAFLGDYYISREYYEKSMKSFTVLPGDIIVSCAGTIGETYILPSGIETGIINQALMRMRITKEIDIKFFLTYFEIILKQNSIEKSKGSAIKNIPPFEIFKSMLVPLPPLAEQKRIVAKVEELLNLVNKLEL